MIYFVGKKWYLKGKHAIRYATNAHNRQKHDESQYISLSLGFRHNYHKDNKHRSRITYKIK
jgi:hypothetical protein